ncbi:MAG: VCBS repeat-containing protein [Chitinophagales bacterium]|nr:VCBS repeat-containing protein [Bacteroidota bacterium]MCB9043271.1 VCBS repeat-containing protein [Chitinophagales bacterium]
MKKILFLGVCFLCNIFSTAQTLLFEVPQNISVKAYNQYLKYPWAGGLNNPQYSQADMNNDGKMDWVIFDKSDNHFLCFLQQANQTMQYAPELAQLFPPIKSWALLRDYNCDGVPDLFFSYKESVRVYEGSWQDNVLQFSYVNNNFMFADDKVMPISSYDLPDINDIDGDGDLDILTFNPDGGYIWYFENISSNCGLSFDLVDSCWAKVFESGISQSLELNASCSGKSNNEKRHPGSTLMSWDINGDNLRDLIIGDISFNGWTYIQNGGTATDALAISQDDNFPSYNVPANILSFPSAFRVDVDLDGKDDLLGTPNSTALFNSYYCTWWYKNTGAGGNTSFSLQNKSFMTDEMIDCGKMSYPLLLDYNADGLLDLLVGCNANSLAAEATVNIATLKLYKNVGTATEAAFELVNDNYLNFAERNLLGLAPALGDLNNDGAPDLLLGCAGSDVSSSQSTLNGTLIYLPNLAAPNEPYNFGEPQFLFNDIDVGQLSAPSIFDVNKDGLKDIIVGERLGKLNYFRNAGDLIFEKINTFWGGVDVRDSSATGHSVPYFFNWQGEDILLCGAENGKVYAFAGFAEDPDGFTTFSQIPDFLQLKNATFTHSAIAIADIDQNNKLDIFCGNLRGGVFALETANITGITTIEEATQGFYFNYFNRQIEIPASVYQNMLGKEAAFRLYNTQGQCVFSADVDLRGTNITLPAELPVGTYIGTLILSQERVFSGKLVVY